MCIVKKILKPLLFLYIVKGLKKILADYVFLCWSSYRECGDPGHFIHETYFCDGEPNCATDSGPEGPVDESDRFCAAATMTQPGETEDATPPEDMAFGKTIN